MVPGADAILPARGGRAFDYRRRAQFEDAVGDESQDKVPRVVPAVRAVGPRRTPEQVLRTRPAESVHGAGGAATRGTPHAAYARARAPVRDRKTAHRALDDPGGNSR